MLLYKLRIFIATICVVNINLAAAQNKTLSIGDHMPDVIMKNVINYPKTELKLSDLKGKYVILDFWNHNCHYCLASFKTIDSLQRLFADKLQIILVNKEDKMFTENFFKTKKQIKKPEVPLATGNTKLIDLFPRDGYPYSVWIDKNGVIKQMALAHNITATHLAEFVEERLMSLNNATRKIFYGPLFNYKNDSLEKKIGYFSCITRYIDDLNIGYTELSKFNDSLVEISSSSSSIAELYKKAYSEGGKYNFNVPGGFELKVKDPSVFVRPTDPDLRDEWDKVNSYNYTLLLPIRKQKTAYTIMQQDLDRYFGLKASVITRSENEKPSHVLVLGE
jgi:thiol-disulfide isomerase/thioredoxin